MGSASPFLVALDHDEGPDEIIEWPWPWAPRVGEQIHAATIMDAPRTIRKVTWMPDGHPTQHGTPVLLLTVS